MPTGIYLRTKPSRVKELVKWILFGVLEQRANGSTVELMYDQKMKVWRRGREGSKVAQIRSALVTTNLNGSLSLES